MNLLELSVHTPAAAALGRTLAHSVWEGALAALLLAAALCVLRTSRARYAAACLAMVALLAGVGFTFQHILAQDQFPSRTAVHALRIAPAPEDSGAGPANPLRFEVADYLPWLAPFWIVGVFFFQVRGALGWMMVRRLRHRGVCAASANWQAMLAGLSERLRLSRPVLLLESSLSEVPVVVGYVRPVILMPLGLLAGLPPAQVESILLHELAHIRRHDYLVNLLQMLVESLVFYHPAVWWISGIIRTERENCCDDLAVATQGDAFAYASALTALEQNRGAVREAVLAATGGSLLKRIRRLLVQPESPRAALAPVFSAALLAIGAAAVLAAWQSSPPPPPATPYEKWAAEDVAYIIRDDERATFKALRTDSEREHFIEQFWLRRDPVPSTAANEFKEEHYRRIAYANQRFAAAVAGWRTDRGRIYIVYGPPDEKEVHPTPVPREAWLYRHIAGMGNNVIVEFTDPDKTGDYRMTTDPHAK